MEVASGKHPRFSRVTPVQLYFVTDAQYKKLPRSKRKNFKRCPECGKWFDMRELDEVFYHCVDGHVPKAKIQFRSPDVTVE